MSKYKNIIVEPEYLKVPKWEYAALVDKATRLEILQTLIENDKKFMAADLLEVMFGSGKGEDE